MATSEQVLNRRKLVNKLMIRLDEADPNQVTNNDVRRLSEFLPMVLNFLRHMEKYPRGVPIFNPCDVLRPDHVGTELLDRFAGRDLRHTLQPGSILRIEEHLKVCTVCHSRWKFFESKLVNGQHVLPGSADEPHRPVMDTSGMHGGPTTLNPHIGIAAGAFRDDQ